MNTWKALQRKIYDVLSHKYFLLVVFPCLLVVLLLLSIIQVGEVWSRLLETGHSGGYLPAVGRSCSEDMEIDVVYTWVNGSDPTLIQNLNRYKQYHNENIKRWSQCPHLDCEPSHFVLYSGCDALSTLSQEDLPAPYKVVAGPNLSNSPLPLPCKNVSSNLLLYPSIKDAYEVIKKSDQSFSQGFWTTDYTIPEGFPTPEWMRFSGLDHKLLSLPESSLIKIISRHIRCPVLEAWPNVEHSFVIFKLPSSEDVDRVLHKSRVQTISGSVVVATRVALAFNVPLNTRLDHFAPSRFEDKEELRYSLRSLEKFAPWVRHVYLVTNGQIPHWLDLDNPRVTLVTHDDIFPNKSHLPTFSSPAIESHLHRIKGLSNKFIYLNDDIMFAQKVWPEDFYTNSRGFKVYLSWPVPDCSSTCLWSWVGDGTCDAECNIPDCGYDGGDCNGTISSSHSLKIRHRDDFLAYDDTYDINFENSDGPLRNNVDLHYLQAPALEMPDNNGDRQLPSDGLDVTEDDHLIKVQEHFRNNEDQDVQRPKRAAVKKNLASLTYAGSSMIAGKSADFPVSVTNSEFAINQALLTATKLRNMERPRHRSPFPQTDSNETNAVIAFFNQKDIHHGHGHTQNIVSTESSVHLKYENSKVDDHMLNSTVLLNKTQIHALENRTSDSVSKLDHSSFRKTLASWTKEKERRQNRMEKEFNESIDQLTEKEYHRLSNFGKPRNRVLDSFAESLLHVNLLYNKVYGFETRRVPAHAPHLIDKHIMSQLQEKFAKEFEETSSHKFRSPKDMQFAFSYFYYLMSEEVDISIEELFDMFDTDHSRTWSDREIRTLLTRVFPAPLSPNHLLDFEETILDCARNLPPTQVPSVPVSTPMYERYQDSPLPVVSWELVNNCPHLKKDILEELKRRRKYPFETVREWSKDVTFTMLHSNVSHLVGDLDEIRRNPKKFVCLNDNLDPKQESENSMVRAVLRDFYHSFFPLPSSFELPVDMRNRFLHVSELNEWMKSRTRLYVAIILAVITLCLLTFAVLCPDEVRHYGRRLSDSAMCLQRRRLSRVRCKSRSPV